MKRNGEGGRLKRERERDGGTEGRFGPAEGLPEVGEWGDEVEVKGIKKKKGSKGSKERGGEHGGLCIIIEG